jgi:beta-galactosidase
VAGVPEGVRFGAAYYTEYQPLPADPWRSARPDSVTCTSSVTPDGRVVRFLHNWSWTDADYVPPAASHDLISEAEVAAGEPLRLTSWDVRVLMEAQ